MTDGRSMPDSAYVVLAILAEGENHGYDIEKLVHNRGFRFWANLQRSSVYKALLLLEKQALITAHERSGAGPSRKVYRITGEGLAQLRRQGLAKLAAPAHPHSEIDLAIYVLPFLPRAEATAALARCREHLEQRAAFLAERLAWCRERGLALPALAFERPLLALRAELTWLDRVVNEYATLDHIRPDEWAEYLYQEP